MSSMANELLYISVTAKLGGGKFDTVTVGSESEVLEAKQALRAKHGNVKILVTRHLNNPQPES